MARDQSMRDARSEGDNRGRAPIDLELGEVIAGKYSIERLLGRGGMGTVWLCTHLGLGERVAVKIISRLVADNAEVRARFEREARASAKIKSRYVARVYDTGELPDGRPYLVMEYMEGETLGQALQVAKTMSLVETARILGQVGRGLERAHELGIVHRDIKPDNVFLAHTADDGVIAKVFDFGIVKVFDAISAGDDSTQEGALLGTPQYMSPEQVEGLAVDLRSDIYALGVMAFRMLTGKRLFPGESLSATLMKICNGPLPSLMEFLPELPPAVDAWFQRTCARDREQRFESAIECVDALASAAGVAATPEVSVPPAAVTSTGALPALPSGPLEPLTGMSAVHPTAPPIRSSRPPPPLDGARNANPRWRATVGVVGGVVGLGLALFFLLSRESHTPALAGPVAATSALAAPPPTVPPTPAPSVVAAPEPPAAASADPVASAQPDASTRLAPRLPTPRRHEAPRSTTPSRGDTAPPPQDERIHDVGY